MLESLTAPAGSPPRTITDLHQLLNHCDVLSLHDARLLSDDPAIHHAIFAPGVFASSSGPSAGPLTCWFAPKTDEAIGVPGTGSVLYVNPGLAVDGDPGFERPSEDREQGRAIWTDLGACTVVCIDVPKSTPQDITKADRFLTTLTSYIDDKMGDGRPMIVAAHLGFPLTPEKPGQRDGYERLREELGIWKQKRGLVPVQSILPLKSHYLANGATFFVLKNAKVLKAGEYNPMGGSPWHPIHVTIEVPGLRRDRPVPSTSFNVRGLRRIRVVDKSSTGRRSISEVLEQQLLDSRSTTRVNSAQISAEPPKPISLAPAPSNANRKCTRSSSSNPESQSPGRIILPALDLGSSSPSSVSSSSTSDGTPRRARAATPAPAAFVPESQETESIPSPTRSNSSSPKLRLPPSPPRNANPYLPDAYQLSETALINFLGRPAIQPILKKVEFGQDEVREFGDTQYTDEDDIVEAGPSEEASPSVLTRKPPAKSGASKVEMAEERKARLLRNDRMNFIGNSEKLTKEYLKEKQALKETQEKQGLLRRITTLPKPKPKFGGEKPEWLKEVEKKPAKPFKPALAAGQRATKPKMWDDEMEEDPILDSPAVPALRRRGGSSSPDALSSYHTRIALLKGPEHHFEQRIGSDTFKAIEKIDDELRAAKFEVITESGREDAGRAVAAFLRARVKV